MSSAHRRTVVGFRAFTLVEMLVAMTASLILFGAVMTIFQLLSETVGRSRRMARLDEDLCSVTTQLQQDLAGVTANRDAGGLLSPVPSGIADGYFEAFEGPNSDLWDNAPALVNKALNRSADRVVGDVDDMLFFTTRSMAADPFTGKFGNTTISSFDAEVAYFCRPTPNTSGPQLYTLCRRQQLIIGVAAVPPFDSAGSMPFPPGGWPAFYDQYDLSVRLDRINGANFLYLNTTNDLQRRRNRFAHHHDSNGAANDLGITRMRLPQSLLNPNGNQTLSFSGARQNEESLLTNVIAFDVRLLEPDPNVRERIGANTTRLQPGDKDYWLAGAADVALGGSEIFVDLGYNRLAVNNGAALVNWAFSGYGAVPGIVGGVDSPCTYDTWSTVYRDNRIDDDDSGTIDDDEISPYAHSLPGVQVTVRLYDAATKTIRQKTVTRRFNQ